MTEIWYYDIPSVRGEELQQNQADPNRSVFHRKEDVG